MKKFCYNEIMKKLFIVVMFFVFFVTPVLSHTVLEGKASYTLEIAQKEAFDGVVEKISMDEFKDKIQDKNYKENKRSLKIGANFEDRNVQLFKRGAIKAYAVTYKSNLKYTYYYSTLVNNLLFVDIGQGEEKFPYKIVRYSFNGDLLAVGYYVSEEERFLFDKNRKLLSHWIGTEGYNRKGKKIGELEIISD